MIWPELSPLLAIVPILSFTLLLMLVTRKPPELCFFSTVSLIAIILYLLCFLGWLRHFSFILFWLGTISAPLLMVYYFRLRGLSRKIPNFFTPSLTLSIVTCVVYWNRFKEQRFLIDDEFNHWAISLKMMLQNHGFLREEYFTGRLYPPGCRLFQYFISVNTTDVEGTAFFGMFILLIAALGLLLRNYSWRDFYWLILATLIGIYAVMSMGQSFSTVHQDQLLGVYFGVILFSFFNNKPDTREMALYSAPIIFMALNKQPGGGLALSVLLLMFATWLYFIFIKYRNINFNNLYGIIKRSDKWMRIIWLTTVFLCLAAGVSWKTYSDHMHLKKPLPELRPFSIERFVDSLTTNEDSLEKRIRDNFFTSFIHAPVNSYTSEKSRLGKMLHKIGLDKEINRAGRLSVFGWFLMTSLIFLITYYAIDSPTLRQKFLLTYLFVLLVFTGFYFSLLRVLLFNFGEMMATKIGGFTRKSNILLIGIFLFSMGTFISQFYLRSLRKIGYRHKILNYSLPFMIVMLVFYLETPDLQRIPTHPVNSIGSKHYNDFVVRHRMNGLAEKMKKILPRTSKVLVVKDRFPGHGVQFVALRYYMYPLSAKYPFTVSNVQKRDKETYLNILLTENITHVYILQCNKNVANYFKNNFLIDVSTGDLLKVSGLLGNSSDIDFDFFQKV